MRIYSMTATFGKLSHKTLTLEKGMNVIHAPNEWGKSTWCAFLVAMLYGIDTSTRSKKDFLAEKEHYAPWSGEPMSGRMDINWHGKDITIERHTKGRAIFGDFKAYETATGLPVGELTADNCGQQLLGVEKNVFVRAGFLRLTDLPVTQDEALRRRLNALVTTGDESGASDVLAQKLKDLKNRCRFHKSGLLPQAEMQRDALEEKLNQIQLLQVQTERIEARQKELKSHEQKLQNHKTALEYAEEEGYAQKVAQAKLQREMASKQVAQLRADCENLPSPEQLNYGMNQVRMLTEQREALQMEAQMQPPMPAEPDGAAPFRGMPLQQVQAQAEADAQQYAQLQNGEKKASPVLLICGAVAMVAGVVLLVMQQIILGAVLLTMGAVTLVGGLLQQNAVKSYNQNLHTKMQMLTQRYYPLDVSQWETEAEHYAKGAEAYRIALENHRQTLAQLEMRMARQNAEAAKLTGGKSLRQYEQELENAVQTQNALADAVREMRRAEDLVQTLEGSRKPVKMPDMEDTMTYPLAETNRLLSDVAVEQKRLHLQLGQCQGQAEALGQPEQLRQQLRAVCGRIDQLKTVEAALNIAQQTQLKAAAELQRRFAPRISHRAQELFHKLTAGRYDRLTLGEDLSLCAGAQGENTLRGSLWRSDGTIDQLYLALRLAVAEELTPNAPLVLDDALVRFDDERLALALEILKEESKGRQVILFTCQGREKAIGGI